MKQATFTFGTSESSIHSDSRCTLSCSITDTDNPDAKPVQVRGLRHISLFLDGGAVLRGRLGLASLLQAPWVDDLRAACPGLVIQPSPLEDPELIDLWNELDGVRASAHCIFVTQATLNLMSKSRESWVEEADPLKCDQGVLGYWDGLPVLLSQGILTEGTGKGWVIA